MQPDGISCKAVLCCGSEAGCLGLQAQHWLGGNAGTASGAVCRDVEVSGQADYPLSHTMTAR